MFGLVPQAHAELGSYSTIKMTCYFTDARVAAPLIHHLTTIHHHAPAYTVLTAILFQLQLPPPGVPRGARLYPTEAPRRPLPLRGGQQQLRHVDVAFETYVQANAPEEGAMPCWPCPFCIIARFYCGRHHLFRHLRDTHKDVSVAEMGVCYAQADVSCLVCCRKRKAMQGWQSILQ